MTTKKLLFSLLFSVFMLLGAVSPVSTEAQQDVSYKEDLKSTDLKSIPQPSTDSGYSDRHEYAPQAAPDTTVSYSEGLSNGNFENGHSAWTEWQYSNGWSIEQDIITNNASQANNGSWYAHLSDPVHESIETNRFTLPNDVVELNVYYNYYLNYSSDCYTGAMAPAGGGGGWNGVVVFMVNQNDPDENYALIPHTSETGEPSNNSYQSMGFAVTVDPEILRNKTYFLDFYFMKYDTSCNMDFYMDDVSVQIGRRELPQPTENAYVYRFRSDAFDSHFFTASYSEANNVDNNDPNWSFETVAFVVYPNGTNAVDSKPVFRLWSDPFKVHFYTMSTIERDDRDQNDPNWAYEGPAWRAYPSNYSGGVPTDTLYRLWSSTKKRHFYTTNVSERDNLVNNDPNWELDGPAYRVLKFN